MGQVRVNPASVVRRGIARASEILFCIQVLDSLSITTGLMAVALANFPAFILISLAFSAFYDLLDMVIRPDLSHIGKTPCNEDSPMLPFDKGK